MKLITTTQAAAELGISRQRVTVLIREGRLPAEQVYPDGPWLINPKHLDSVRERKGKRGPTGTTAA